MTLRKAFKTDRKVESAGIEVEFDDAIVTVARAGGSNKAYKKAVVKALRPYRASLEADTVDDERLTPTMIKVFVQHCVLGWKTLVGDVWVEGIEAESGPPVPFTKEAAEKFLIEVPELYYHLQEKATSRRLFLEDLEEAAKNS
jgi:hypothetical protein